MNTRAARLATFYSCLLVSWLIASPLRGQAQGNLTLRVMAANLTGNSQSYGASQIRIFQGLKPDVVCIQEFNYGGNTPGEIRSFVNTAFGSDFQYTRETNTSYDIPNGVISRFPIIAAGSWDDAESPNRGFAWAQIDLPGTNDLFAVSVHLLTSSITTRGLEAAELKAIIQTNFPPNAWVVVAGDLNTDNRGEAAVTTLKTFLSDNPIPADQVAGGDPNTNLNRNKPYDYVLPSFSLTNRLTNVVIGNYAFPSGLVFDSRVFTNLPDVSPVLLNDSANGQHMAVIKDFAINSDGTNPPASPFITHQPLSQTNAVGQNATFTVTATGSEPLRYQWQLDEFALPGANTSSLTITNIQTTNAGNYSVVITNLAGTTTSTDALLTVMTQPVITDQPQSLTVAVGESANFLVSAAGQPPLVYQWRLRGTNLPGANDSSLTLPNVQLADAGDYAVVITNATGSTTSVVATLTVNAVGTMSVIAQWNFNTVPPDGNTGTGTTAPSFGNGIAALVGGTTSTFATGDTTLDPAGSTDNSGWNTTTYPAQSTGNKTRGVQFNVNTTGKKHIVVTWSSQSSNTGSKYERLQYSTNGTSFVDFPTATTNSTQFTPRTNNLSSLAGVDDNTAFAIRILSEFESTATGVGSAGYVAANPGSTYGTPGTVRFDMVTVWGTTISASNPPAQSATLTDVALDSGQQFQFLLTGSTGSNYIVQATADLIASNWISLLTNTAPFMFVETNVFVSPQRFYRGLIAP